MLHHYHNMFNGIFIEIYIAEFISDQGQSLGAVFFGKLCGTGTAIRIRPKR